VGAAKATSLNSKPPKESQKEVSTFKNLIPCTEKYNDVSQTINNRKWLSNDQRKTLLEVNEFFVKLSSNREEKEVSNALPPFEPLDNKISDAHINDLELEGKKAFSSKDSSSGSWAPNDGLGSDYSGDWRWWLMMRTYPEAIDDAFGNIKDGELPPIIDRDEDAEYFGNRMERLMHRDMRGVSSDHSSHLAESVESVTKKVTINLIKTHPLFQNKKYTMPYDSYPYNFWLRRKIGSDHIPTLKTRACFCKEDDGTKYPIFKIKGDLINQLFTPVKLGTNGINTYIQLDSGAATNLIGSDMANELDKMGLINFTYDNLINELTDVQNNVINQSRKPINVTLWFDDNKEIRVAFQVVENLEYPLLGIGSMVENDISIINSNCECYLCIGNINAKSTLIRNASTTPSDIFLSDQVVIKSGLNKVSCYSSIAEGVVNTMEEGVFIDTIIRIPTQTVKFVDHHVELLINNLSQNDFE